MIVTRQNFASKKDRGESDKGARKSQPLNKFKELKHIYKRNDIPNIPIALINTRVEEYNER